MVEIDVPTVIVGRSSERPRGSPPRWLTRRTVYAFVLLIALFFAYEFYCINRVYSFSYAFDKIKPSYCPSSVWHNSTLSSSVFGNVYLNPFVNNTKLALDAAVLCRGIENQTTARNNSGLGTIRYNVST